MGGTKASQVLGKVDSALQLLLSSVAFSRWFSPVEGLLAQVSEVADTHPNLWLHFRTDQFYLRCTESWSYLSVKVVISNY